MTILPATSFLRRGAMCSVLCWVVWLTCSTPVHAQERATLKTVDQRLQRVEGVLDQSLLKLLQRIDSLQQEVRVLTGEVESLGYELQKQQQRNRELYRDTDRRVGLLEAASAAGSPLDELGEGGALDETLDGTLDETSSLDRSLSDEVGDETSGAARYVDPNRVALVNSDANDPLAPRVPVRASTTRAATQVEKGAYADAYDLLARGDNDGAIQAFDQFLREFPDGPFSDNAWYWQGEARYASRDFDQARKNFSIVVSSFPESAKVPDARLKVGYSLYEQGDFSQARKVLTEVQNDYPGRSASVLARKRLQKMDRDGN